MPRRNNQIKHIRLIQPTNNCQSKRAYKNEKEAIKAAELQMLMDFKLELDTYKCVVCYKWHLTRRK